MTYVNESPNFSIVLPGACNARCGFCFWSRSANEQGFAKGLDRAMRELPPHFRTVSITGGEPTLSPALTLALTAIKRRTWHRVVLTTNGARLAEHLGAIAKAVTHVNVSRHGTSDRENRARFGTNSVPTAQELEAVIDSFASRGVPVTLVRVLRDDETRAKLGAYLRFARRVGAAGVHFRKPNGDLAPHPVEAQFAYAPARESSCPACLNREQYLEGVQVVWKRGIIETANVGKHEVVLQSSGALTWDWAGRAPYAAEPLVPLRVPPVAETRRRSYGCAGLEDPGC